MKTPPTKSGETSTASRVERTSISLPPKLLSRARQNASGGDYSSVSDYIADLIRRDQQRAPLAA